MHSTAYRKYLPIRFISLESEGFSFFPRQEIPFHQKINISAGLNGTGKTTFLNMLRVLIGSRKYDNNQTLNSFFERDDVSEIYIVARFDNRLNTQYGRRPFQTIGKKREVVSVVCRIKKDTLKREYSIFDGSFDLEMDLKGYIRWLTVEQYSRQMQEVGLSRALINACSLNQGNTEELMDKSEEELANYILQVCGEQERIDRFHQIKTEIKQLQEQYTQINYLKQDEERTLREIERNLEFCARIVRLQEEIKSAEYEIPIAQYVELAKEVDELLQIMQELEKEILSLKETEQLLTQELSIHHREKEVLDTEFIQMKDELQSNHTHKSSITIQLHKATDAWNELSHFVETYASIPKQDVVILEQEILEYEKEHRNATGETAVLQKQKDSLSTRIERLLQLKKAEFPPQVIQMRAWLGENKIDHLLLADCIEIKDEEWREAFEAMLGNERFTIAVQAKDIVQVMKVAQAARYPYWISPYKEEEFTLRSEAVLQKVSITDSRISGYLERYARYMVAGDMKEAWTWVGKGYQAILNKPFPYQVVERGGRAIKPKGLYCGQKAYEAQLASLSYQLKELIPQLQKAEFLEQQWIEKVQEITKTIEIQQQLLLLPEKDIALKNCIEIKDDLGKTLEELETAIRSWDEKVTFVQVRITEVSEQVGQLQMALQHNKTIVHSKIESREDCTNRKTKKEYRLEAVKNALTSSQVEFLSDPEKVLSLKTQADYQERIIYKGELIESTRMELTPGVVTPGDEHKHIKLSQTQEQHRKMLDQHLEEISKIKNDLDVLEERREEAKREYWFMVNEVFQKVRKSLVEMAQQGGFDADIRAAYFDDDRWKLDYRIGFNGKQPRTYRDKSALSGGQKVIASLLLTFAAIKADGIMSFMILDEPFAHLDEERIALVGNFLSSSGAQIFIGMPYSENIKLFMPWANMLLNFRPKELGMDVAPPITIGEMHGL